LKRAGYGCEDCKASSRVLDVHHCYYIFGLEPWQYPYDALKALCRECHQKRTEIEKVFRASLQSFTLSEIKILHESLSIIPSNYSKKNFFSFFETIAINHTAMEKSFQKFYSSRRK